MKPIFSQRSLTSQLLQTLPNKDTIVTIEDAVKDLEKEENNTIHAKISFTLQNSKPPKDSLSKNEHKALKESHSNTSIVVLPADKGSSSSLIVRTIWKNVWII